jgi:hypothetical protein
MAGGAGGALAPLLDEIWISRLPRTDRRYLCQQVCADWFRGGAAAGRGDVILKAFEEVMRQAGSACGGPIGIGKLRRHLLDSQRPDLAFRLSELNRARRAIAHPDLCLAGEVEETLRGFVVASGGEGGLEAPSVGGSDVFSKDSVHGSDDEEGIALFMGMKADWLPIPPFPAWGVLGGSGAGHRLAGEAVAGANTAVRAAGAKVAGDMELVTVRVVLQPGTTEGHPAQAEGVRNSATYAGWQACSKAHGLRAACRQWWAQRNMEECTAPVQVQVYFGEQDVATVEPLAVETKSDVDDSDDSDVAGGKGTAVTGWIDFSKHGETDCSWAPGWFDFSQHGESDCTWAAGARGFIGYDKYAKEASEADGSGYSDVLSGADESIEAAATLAAVETPLPQMSAVKLKEAADLDQDGAKWLAMCTAARALPGGAQALFVDKMRELLPPVVWQRIELTARAMDDV